MTVTWSENIRNAVLEAWETSIGTGAIVRLYTGAPPAHVSDAESGTKLAEWVLASDWMSNAAGGVKSMNGLPANTVALPPGGIVAHYSIYASDGVTCHERGTVTATGGGGDMTIDNTSLATGQTVKITAYQKMAPGA